MKFIQIRIILVLVIITSWSSMKATDYYLMNNAVGVTVAGAAGAWTQDATGATYILPPANFNGIGNVWHFKNRPSASLSGNFGPPSAATVVIEANFNLNVTTNFGQLNEIIWVAASGTLTISNNKNYNLVNLDPASTVIYSSSTSTGVVQSANYGNLVIAASTSFSNTASNVWVYGDMTVNTGKTINLNGQGVRLNSYGASIAGTGSITSSGNAFIECYAGNGSNNGTLYFTSGSTLDYLYIQYDTPGDYISLGNDLTISLTTLGTFYQSLGSFNLNGHSLIINAGADISFPPLGSGTIMGNSSSGIFINGILATYGTNSLLMDPSNNTLGVLSLNSANTLDIGNAVKINDSLSVQGGGTTNTNGNVTLTSSLNLKGRLGNMNNGTIVGNLTVETFAKGGTTDWAVIGASGIQGLTLSSWDNPATFPMTCNGCINATTSVGGGFASAVSYDETQATPASYLTMSNTDPLTPGKGFWMYMGLTYVTTADMLWTVAGSAVTGNVPVNLTYASPTPSAIGYNLIANPYPSPISWSLALASNPLAPINDAIYIYNADYSTTTSYVGGVSSHANGANDVIPMGQGFYVEATGATPFNFYEGNKVASNTTPNQLLKSSNFTSSSSANIGTVIRLHVSGAGGSDATAIRFHSTATTSFDKSLDAHKIYSSPGYPGYPGVWTDRTVIGTQSGNEDYSINSLPYAQTQNAVIPVIVRVYGSGQHTISASDLQNIPGNTCITLRDKLLNVTQDLRLGNYVCNINDTTYAARFELTVCANAAMTNVKTQAVSVSNSIAINKDAQGIFVDFDFDKATNANIIVTNVLGQKVMDTKKVKVSNDNIYLDLNVADQLIFVTVETENEKVTKKFLNFK